MKPVDMLFPKKALLKKLGKCPICEQEIGEFRDDLSRKEFTISGLCQECQDKTFGV